VLLEDLSTLERTQRAAETGVKKFMVLQDNELLVRHSYHVIERLLAEAEAGVEGKQQPVAAAA